MVRGVDTLIVNVSVFVTPAPSVRVIDTTVVTAALSTVPEIRPAFAPEFVKIKPLGSNVLDTTGQVIGPVPDAINVNE
jgi:hypothetical protein